MRERIKQIVSQFVLSEWYGLIIVFLIMCLGLAWQFNNNKSNEVAALKSQLNMNETIRQTEKRLEEVKDRELQYIELQKKTNTLMKSLSVLDNKQRELEKRKKEVIANEIKNYSQTDIQSALAGINITSVVK